MKLVIFSSFSVILAVPFSNRYQGYNLDERPGDESDFGTRSYQSYQPQSIFVDSQKNPILIRNKIFGSWGSSPKVVSKPLQQPVFGSWN